MDCMCCIIVIDCYIIMDGFIHIIMDWLFIMEGSIKLCRSIRVW